MSWNGQKGAAGPPGVSRVPSGPPREIVEDDSRAKDSVAAWLALQQGAVDNSLGSVLFSLGVPCCRRKIRDAIVKDVYIDADDSTAVWESPLVDGPAAGYEDDAKVERREVSPAVFSYEAPRVFAELGAGLSRWAYETFTAAEFDSMYRLRDSTTPWWTYVQELREGMERQ